MAKRYRVLIGGEWIGDDLPGIDVVNPFDGTIIGVVPEAGDAEVERAIEAARGGFCRDGGNARRIAARKSYQ